MSTFLITGGTPLYGSVRVGGAKNASYKLMIAALLADTPSRLLNFSHISDVERVAQIITELGATAHQVGDRAYMVDPSAWSDANVTEISAKHGAASRASTLFIPVLLARHGRAVVPQPGGDKIGPRPLERHFEGLQALGAHVEVQGDTIVTTAEKLHGATYRFSKNSHTGTETLVMAAALAEGQTILENAAEETEVDDLIGFLNAMGADIKRTAPRTITINGVPQLHGAIYRVMPDQNQVVSFACAALATKGDVIVENARAKDLTAFLAKLDEIGAGYDVGHFGIRFYYTQPLRATDVTTAIHPGFKTDWQPLWVTMMTQAQGISVVHETVHRQRFGYRDELQQMGASLETFQPEVDNWDSTYNFNLDDDSRLEPHALRITGPTALTGGHFAVKDLRHGATLMVAGIIAAGQTILDDPTDHIDRGYERLDDQLSAMGAKIERH